MKTMSLAPRSISFLLLAPFLVMLCMAKFSTLSWAQESVEEKNQYSYVIYDPYEPVNRGIFTFNNAVQKTIIRPIAKGYDSVTPDFMQQRFRDFITFLKTPLSFVNNLAQGDLYGARDSAVRGFVNGTIGLLGFIDVMAPAMPHEDEDFGQTLAVWGIDSGPYIMLPFLGPSNMRDGIGLVVDGTINPISHFVDNTHRLDNPDFALQTTAGRIIVWEADNYTKLESLEDSALDYYSTIRSLYYQNRQSLISDGLATGQDAESLEFAMD